MTINSRHLWEYKYHLLIENKEKIRNQKMAHKEKRVYPKEERVTFRIITNPLDGKSMENHKLNFNLEF